MLEKVLVPLDGSELSDRIVPQLRRLLVAKDVAVTLAQVVPDKAAHDPSGGAALVDAARDHLARIAAPLVAAGANVSSEVVLGAEPAARILELAIERQPSLLVLATHGRSGIVRWIRGSVAERLLRSSPFPLLLANPHALARTEELPIRKILVPLDGSARSAQVLPLVAELARLYGSEVTLFYTVELVVAEVPIAPIMTQAEAAGLLAPFQARLPGIVTHVKSTLGLPAHAIVEEAASGAYDLVALATHGRTGLERWAFGSVAENVVRHAPCPLLVRRTLPGSA